MLEISRERGQNADTYQSAIGTILKMGLDVVTADFEHALRVAFSLLLLGVDHLGGVNYKDASSKAIGAEIVEDVVRDRGGNTSLK